MRTILLALGAIAMLILAGCTAQGNGEASRISEYKATGKIAPAGENNAPQQEYQNGQAAQKPKQEKTGQNAAQAPELKREMPRSNDSAQAKPQEEQPAAKNATDGKAEGQTPAQAQPPAQGQAQTQAQPPAQNIAFEFRLGQDANSAASTAPPQDGDEGLVVVYATKVYEFPAVSISEGYVPQDTITLTRLEGNGEPVSQLEYAIPAGNYSVGDVVFVLKFDCNPNTLGLHRYGFHANYWIGREIRLKCALPPVLKKSDLELSEIRFSDACPAVGDAITVTVVTKNSGETPSEVSHTRIQKPNCNSQNTMQNFEIPSLAPGQSVESSFEYAVCPPLGGTNLFSGMADEYDTNKGEPNTGNNYKYESLGVEPQCS